MGYRMFALRQAQRLGLVGYVKNLPDGRVEAIVEGNREAIDAFLRRLRHGPRRARVDRVEQVIEAATGEFQRFYIKG